MLSSLYWWAGPCHVWRGYAPIRWNSHYSNALSLRHCTMHMQVRMFDYTGKLNCQLQPKKTRISWLVTRVYYLCLEPSVFRLLNKYFGFSGRAEKKKKLNDHHLWDLCQVTLDAHYILPAPCNLQSGWRWRVEMHLMRLLCLKSRSTSLYLSISFANLQRIHYLSFLVLNIWPSLEWCD